MADRTVSKLKTILKKIDKGIVPPSISFKEEVLTKESLEPLRGFQFDCVEVKDSDLDALSSLPPAKVYSFNASQIGCFDELHLCGAQKVVEFVRCLTTIPHLRFMPKTYNFVGITNTPILSVDGMKEHHIIFDPSTRGKFYRYMFHYCLFIEGCNRRLLKSMIDNPPNEISYNNPNRCLDYLGENLYEFSRIDQSLYERLYLRNSYGNSKLVNTVKSIWYKIANSSIGEKLLDDV